MAQPFHTGRSTLLEFYNSERHGEFLVSWYYDRRYRFFFREWAEYADPKRVQKMDEDLVRAGVRLCTILDKTTHRPIGLMTYSCLKPKAGVFIFGIMLDTQFQGQTRAIDAIIVMCDFIYRKMFGHKIVVEFYAGDNHIERITAQGGFTKEAVLKDEIFMDGKYLDEARFALSLDRFEELYGTYFDSCEPDSH